MRVTGLGWLGTRTERDAEPAAFSEEVLSPRPTHTDPPSSSVKTRTTLLASRIGCSRDTVPGDRESEEACRGR